MEGYLATSALVAIGGWLLTAVGLGKYIGKLKRQVQQNTEDIGKIEKTFITSDGDPRFVSYKAHDKIQMDCQTLQNERYDTLVKRMDEKDRILLDHLSKLDDSVMELTKLIACLTGAHSKDK